jgi:hypothetical protein
MSAGNFRGGMLLVMEEVEVEVVVERWWDW